MAGFVKVCLIGNLGKDPEVRFTDGGNAVANIRVACTERAKVKGEWTDVTEWVGVVLFGKDAENAGQYLAKGSQVYVEGRLQTNEWTDKEGNKRQDKEVLCRQIIYLGGKKDNDKKGGEKQQGGQRQQQRGSGRASSFTSRDDGPPLRDDDIPF